MSEIEKLNMIAEWQEQHKQLIEDLNNSKKRITELERINDNLEKELDYQRQARSIAENAVVDLTKENAELKSRDCWKGCLYASGKSELIYEFLQQRYNLTKAKEIIKKIEKIFYNGEEALKRLSKISDIITEAEQFLNSEVEK